MVDNIAPDDDTTTTTNSSQEVNTATDLARLWNNSKPLTLQELKELNAWIKAFEEIAQIEDWLKALESWKRPRSEFSESAIPLENPIAGQQRPTRSSGNSSSHQDYPTTTIRPSDRLDSSSSDSSSLDTVTYHRHKRRRFTRGIKVIPSYTLKVSSSLQEWRDWKKDIKRIFEEDPYTYQTGS